MSPILGPDGKPATTPVRIAAGFTDRTLPASVGDIASAPQLKGKHEGDWYQRGNQNGWRGGWYQEPFAGPKE